MSAMSGQQWNDDSRRVRRVLFTFLEYNWRMQLRGMILEESQRLSERARVNDIGGRYPAAACRVNPIFEQINITDMVRIRIDHELAADLYSPARIDIV